VGGVRVIRILHGVPSLHPGQGGPSRTVVALTDALAGCSGVSVSLVSQGASDEPVVPSSEPCVDRRVATSRSRLALALGLPLRHELGSIGATAWPSLIHSHGVWHPANYWMARAARTWGVPLIIHPRGMLEPWALSQKALKKRMALVLFQRRDLAGARAFVATADMEYAQLRHLGLRQPVAVIPNGVDLAVAPGTEAMALADARGPGGQRGQRQVPEISPSNRERVALFLSRVHPKKGLLELVRAWAQVAPVGWRLRIAGPDEGGHWREVARLVSQLGLEAVIDYVGPVEAERRAALYREADLFVLPTFSENFGVVVAEALAAGVPVITTRGAPWADLVTYGCGWWIETGVPPLVLALREALALGDDERRAMGERGRAYVQRYDWSVIAVETLALYRWVLGQGERPACVHLD